MLSNVICTLIEIYDKLRGWKLENDQVQRTGDQVICLPAG